MGQGVSPFLGADGAALPFVLQARLPPPIAAAQRAFGRVEARGRSSRPASQCAGAICVASYRGVSPVPVQMWQRRARLAAARSEQALHFEGNPTDRRSDARTDGRHAAAAVHRTARGQRVSGRASSSAARSSRAFSVACAMHSVIRRLCSLRLAFFLRSAPASASASCVRARARAIGGRGR